MNIQDHVEVSQEWAEHCERVVNDTIAELDAWFFAYEDEEPEGEEPETPSGLPYDSCIECHDREVMVLMTMLTVEGLRLGHVRFLAPNPKIAGDVEAVPGSPPTPLRLVTE
jgi:hypothetical protein